MSTTELATNRRPVVRPHWRDIAAGLRRELDEARAEVDRLTALLPERRDAAYDELRLLVRNVTAERDDLLREREAVNVRLGRALAELELR